MSHRLLLPPATGQWTWERGYVHHMSWLHRLIYRLAWPSYDCEDCIGAGCGHTLSCYCEHHRCVGPGAEPRAHHRALRRLWSRVARAGGYLDPGR